MKRIFALIITFFIFFMFTACNFTKDNSNIQNVVFNNKIKQETENVPEKNSEIDNTKPSKILIAYFSRTENTKTIAEQIVKLTNGDLFEIKTFNPYPEDYNKCLTQASKELADDYRPELSTHVNNMDDYDVVFIGYPIWHGDTPMAIRSFLDEYDFSGKKVIPFCTSGSSGISKSIAAMRNLCPDSDVMEGICIKSLDFKNAYELIEKWIDSFDFNEDKKINEAEEVENKEGEKNTMKKININVGSSVFSVKLYDNDATRALIAQLPMTLNMSELNGNEKYYYLKEKLPTDSERIENIHTGDLMLYGSDCLVLFYENFSTSYSYTRLGYIEDASGLADALGKGNVQVKFSIVQ